MRMTLRMIHHGNCFAVLFCVATAYAQPNGNDDFFKLGPDSLRHEGVPHGEVHGPHLLPSKVFEGTRHTYWVYVPAQYDAKQPCALMIFNDGHAFLSAAGSARTTNVIDNLVHRREIPDMIAVFINPGRRPDQPEPNASEWGDRTTNRPEEYNSLDDRYARVITEELMPELYSKYSISKAAKDHGIGGCSSGAIAAFTVAWERPGHFTKVLSTVGSFTNIRGGHKYPDIIRESEKKPIRVFLQDGRNDNRGRRRRGYDETWDWFLQNVRMVEAMTEKGYDVNYSWSIGRHGLKPGGVILPEMMRWLWRDHPISTDVNDNVERSFNTPGVRQVEPTEQDNARSEPRTQRRRRGGFGGPMTLGPDDKLAFDEPPAAFDKTRDGIAHGKLEMLEYNSTTVGTQRKVLVYTPPGYSQEETISSQNGPSLLQLDRFMSPLVSVRSCWKRSKSQTVCRRIYKNLSLARESTVFANSTLCFFVLAFLAFAPHLVAQEPSTPSIPKTRRHCAIYTSACFSIWASKQASSVRQPELVPGLNSLNLNRNGQRPHVRHNPLRCASCLYNRSIIRNGVDFAQARTLDNTPVLSAKLSVSHPNAFSMVV